MIDRVTQVIVPGQNRDRSPPTSNLNFPTPLRKPTTLVKMSALATLLWNQNK